MNVYEIFKTIKYDSELHQIEEIFMKLSLLFSQHLIGLVTKHLSN